MGHAENFFAQASAIASQIDHAKVDKLASELAALRERGGRLFVLGVGGSAGNASHSVNDFRKLCGIEAYAPVDNVSELTARANDEGWDTIFTGYLEGSRADADDAIFVFSVGGGDAERNISTNIVKAVDMAKARGMKVYRRGRTRQRPHRHPRRHRGRGSGGRSRAADATFGSVPGGGMALPGVASGAAEKRHQMVTRAVFADRDGVLCANMMRDGRPVAPTRLEDFRLLPGVEDSVRALKSAGYLVIVVTNQPDVGTGRTPRATVEAMHDIIRAKLAVDDIKACFHTNADGCTCRKPKPGMILEAAAERAIDLPASYRRRRPLERRRGRPGGRLRDHFCRLRL